MRKDPISSAVIVSLVALTAYLWWGILSGTGAQGEAFAAMLDVGQGDSVFIRTPEGANIMVDAGPDRSVVSSLEKVFKGKYIDVAVLSHPEKDHFGGFLHVLDRYDVGVFITNGRVSESREWEELMNKLDSKGVQVLTLLSGDSISHGDARMDIISPVYDFAVGAETNDSAIVSMLNVSGTKMLLTGDISEKVEEYLADKFDLSADILKVAHHGSKFSTSAGLLAEARPRVFLVGVGANNTYGHPSKEVLSRISGGNVYRTDIHGNIKLVFSGKKLSVLVDSEGD